MSDGQKWITADQIEILRLAELKRRGVEVNYYTPDPRSSEEIRIDLELRRMYNEVEK